MSRIDALIAELCSEGVAFIPVKDLFETRSGYTPSRSDASNWIDGTVPWFRMEDIRENGRVLAHSIQRIPESAVKGGRLFPANSIIVATSATIGEHALITVPFLSNQRFTALWLKPQFTSRFDMKFVFYYCFVLDEWCCNNVTTSSFASVDMVGFKRFRFPVPPLEVQREIARVLDTFTELEAELEAELKARRRQYEHYRDSLLRLSNKSAPVPLGDVVANLDSQRRPVTRSDRRAGAFPYYGANGVQDYVDGYLFDGTFLLIGEDGSVTQGDGSPVLHWATGKIWVNNHAHVLTSRADTADLRFLYHYLRTVDIRRFVTGSAQPKLNQRNLNLIPVRLPRIEEQRRIASILDKFDALVNDLSIGLPAELNARRKQYEHYRDRLLTFSEAA